MHHKTERPEVQDSETFTESLRGKNIIVDTSSLLMSGTKLLTYLSDGELVIPSVVVSELEAKRSHATLGILARQWINLLEDLRVSDGEKLREGVSVGEASQNSTIRVEPNHSAQTVLPAHLQDGSIDSTILAVAFNTKKDVNNTRPVILLSNDTPMRLHATLDLKLAAYEFSSSIANPNTNDFTSRISITLSEEEYAGFEESDETFLHAVESLVTAELDSTVGFHALVDVRLAGDDTVQHTYMLEGDRLQTIDRKVKASHITGRSIEQDAVLHYLLEPADLLPIVSVVGSAGTGKTLLTVAAALQLIDAKKYEKIVTFRSLHEMGQGQEMGFLPGDVADKMGPWGGAIGDALDVIAEKRKPRKKNDGQGAVDTRQNVADKLAEKIEVSPITYLRGRSLSRSFIILDEAQNFSRTELLNIISRVGENSKLVILSDPMQVDNRFLQTGEKSDVWSVIKDFSPEDVFAHVELTKTERSFLAQLASIILEKN